MSAFQFSDYKSYLKDLVAKSGRGAVSEFAAAAGCDRTYFSQTLNGKAHLTPDHMIALSEFLSLQETEKNFVLLLLLRDRAASSAARIALSRRIDKLTEENLLLTKRIKTKESPNEVAEKNKARYYSSWLFGAIHILTSIPEFQTSSAIAQRLRLNERVVKQHLEALEEMNLVEKSKDQYKHRGGNLHVASDSPHNSANHVNFRMRTIAKLTSVGAGDDLHYSSGFSISKKDWAKLKQHAMQFIDEHRSLVHASGTEEAYTIAIDLQKLE